MLLHAGATEGGPKTVCGIEICPTRFHLSLQAIKKYALLHHQISFQIAVFEGSVLDITTFPKGLVYMFDIGMTEEIYAHLSLCMWWTTTVNHLVSYQTPRISEKIWFPRRVIVVLQGVHVHVAVKENGLSVRNSEHKQGQGTGAGPSVEKAIFDPPVRRGPSIPRKPPRLDRQET